MLHVCEEDVPVTAFTTFPSTIVIYNSYVTTVEVVCSGTRQAISRSTLMAVSAVREAVSLAYWIESGRQNRAELGVWLAQTTSPFFAISRSGTMLTTNSWSSPAASPPCLYRLWPVEPSIAPLAYKLEVGGGCARRRSVSGPRPAAARSWRPYGPAAPSGSWRL